jgi:hypothetical protein
MSEERKKSSLSFWTTVVVVVVLVGYPLSLGPVCWIKCDAERHEVVVPTVYWPIGWIMRNTDPSASNRISILKAVQWYIGFGVREHVRITFPTHYRKDNSWMFGSLLTSPPATAPTRRTRTTSSVVPAISDVSSR